MGEGRGVACRPLGRGDRSVRSMLESPSYRIDYRCQRSRFSCSAVAALPTQDNFISSLVCGISFRFEKGGM